MGMWVWGEKSHANRATQRVFDFCFKVRNSLHTNTALTSLYYGDVKA